MILARLAFAAVLAVPCLLAAPAPTRACGNSVWSSYAGVNDALHRAEEMVARGRHRQAVALIRQQFEEHTLGTPVAPGRDQILHARGQQLLSLAVARTRGAVVLGPGLGGKRQEQRDAAITWAIARMRWHIANGTDSNHIACDQGKCHAVDEPVRTVILAELLAFRSDGRAEALQLLSQLERDDLMPTPAGWGVLAALYRQDGRTDDAERAAARCRQIAGDDDHCSVAL